MVTNAGNIREKCQVKSHNTTGIRMSQYKTPDRSMFEKEGIIFKNGTEITIPPHSIGDIYPS
jgi:hypothetical protein